MLTKVEDVRQIEDFRKRLDEIIQSPYHLNVSWIGKHRWTVGVLEGAAYFSLATATTLADSISQLSCGDLYAVPSEDLNPPQFVVRIQATQQDLLSLSEIYPLSLLLLSKVAKFAVLLTPDYHLVAGSRSFVERAIGSTAPVAYERLMAMFNQPDTPLGIREVYEGLTRYLPFTVQADG